MDSLALKSFMARVKWPSVLLVAVLIVIVGILLYLISENVSPGFTVEDDLGIRVSVEPKTIEVGDSDGAALAVEVTNRDERDDVTVTVSAETHDANFVFGYPDENATKAVREGIVIGPGEIKKVSFTAHATPDALEGQYLVDVEAAKNRLENVEESIYVDVEKKP